MKVAALLLAGGASSRMGARDKLLEQIDGVPLLRDRALMSLNSKAALVRVVLPPNRPNREDALSELDVEVVFNGGSELGMSHSIQIGIEGMDADAVLIVLADLPDLTTTDLNKLINAATAHPLANVLRGANQAGKPGHPVLIRRALFGELSQLSGDTGAQPVLKRHLSDTVLVPVGAAALRDLDTPEEWDAWRAERTT
ncbi:MAG: nucleotidyltransferase family protein [Litoreibacter sp.]|uniref:nucleotidyltransferase family protein n=1 Tax=Litoreibacter sp. TaxID=1969459 RepID=UPI003299879F